MGNKKKKKKKNPLGRPVSFNATSLAFIEFYFHPVYFFISFLCALARCLSLPCVALKLNSFYLLLRQSTLAPR